MPWLPAVFIVTSALTGGAVLRAAGRIFLGVGGSRHKDVASRNEGGENETGQGSRTPALMFITMAGLLVLACVVGLFPPLFEQAQLASARLFNTAAYAHTVLGGAPSVAVTANRVLEPTRPTAFDVGTGFAAAAGAVLVAVLGWGSERGPYWWQQGTGRVTALFGPLQRLHSGDVRDYVAWLVLGAGVLGAIIGSSALNG
jgi:multicomponent Na+:H+ antiporter subunit D